MANSKFKIQKIEAKDQNEIKRQIAKGKSEIKNQRPKIKDQRPKTKSAIR
jgi:hypothetical protein